MEYEAAIETRRRAGGGRILTALGEGSASVLTPTLATPSAPALGSSLPLPLAASANEASLANTPGSEEAERAAASSSGTEAGRATRPLAGSRLERGKCALINDEVEDDDVDDDAADSVGATLKLVVTVRMRRDFATARKMRFVSLQPKAKGQERVRKGNYQRDKRSGV